MPWKKGDFNYGFKRFLGKYTKFQWVADPSIWTAMHDHAPKEPAKVIIRNALQISYGGPTTHYSHYKSCHHGPMHTGHFLAMHDIFPAMPAVVIDHTRCSLVIPDVLARYWWCWRCFDTGRHMRSQRRGSKWVAKRIHSPFLVGKPSNFQIVANTFLNWRVEPL